MALKAMPMAKRTHNQYEIHVEDPTPCPVPYSPLPEESALRVYDIAITLN